MSSWLNEYLLAIEERDRKESTHQDLYKTYTRLADRISGFGLISIQRPSLVHDKSSAIFQGQISPDSRKPQANDTSLDALVKVREDLGEAQRSKGQMQLQMQNLTQETQRLRTQSKFDRRRISDLIMERTNLVTRMRDRDEELKGKAKLLEHIHDETVSLTLQLNLAEEQSRKLKLENKELVDRWMARMGEEADAMNNASRFS